MSCEEGDIEAVLANCEYIIDQVYHTKANQQAMMETFRTYTYLDTYGRLNVLSSTQVPFHVRRILANALDIPKSKIRENGKTGKDDFYKRRIYDCILSAARDGGSCPSWS